MIRIDSTKTEGVQTALSTVKAFYDALGRGDVATMTALLDDDLEWTEAEGFPYFAGTWRSSKDVVEHLFVPLGRDWDGFSAIAETFVTQDGTVVAFGNYGGINRATGRTLAAPFAHRWLVANGRIVSFVQYTDTLLVDRAMPFSAGRPFIDG